MESARFCFLGLLTFELCQPHLDSLQPRPTIVSLILSSLKDTSYGDGESPLCYNYTMCGLSTEEEPLLWPLPLLPAAVAPLGQVGRVELGERD